MEAVRTVCDGFDVSTAATTLAETWPRMTPEQKRGYLEHSSVFASIVEPMQPFKDVM